MKKRRKTISVSTGIAITAALAFVASAGFAYSLVRDLPNPDRLAERAIAQSTKIFDRTGKVLLYEIHGEEKRTLVSLADIPESMQKATLAAEDMKFYDHWGIDPRGVLRALFVNIREGGIRQGGSTITQQLVKKAFLSDERTPTRKFREALLAILLERKYEKNQILEWYLNQIPYGSNAYGIASAARTFFRKDTRDLTLAEAALLASLPKAPTYYSPYGSHKEELYARAHGILDRMAEAGFVSREEAERAKNEKLEFASPEPLPAAHFVMYVREYLNEQYGEEFVSEAGLTVITTLDAELQKQAETVIREGAEANEKAVQAYNASLVAIDPKTGEILAMAGSRGWEESPLPEGCTPGKNCKFDPHVNVAVRARQPGSAFKPFVYATAFKKGYTPETVLFDAPTEFNPRCNPDGTPGPGVSDRKECYHPQNYDNRFRGPVSLRQAIAQSLNVPSVKLLYLAGVQDSINTAREMGISTLGDASRYGLSLVLGGAEVTLLDMVSAYGVFAQDGILHPKTAILKIEAPDGRVLEEKKDAAVPAIDTQVARIMNDVLSDNDARIPVFNPRSSLYFPGRQVAAKTGTTQDYRDAWVVGYTPSLVAGVWVGNNDNSEMVQSGASVMVAGPIWNRFMRSALEKMPPEGFTPPERTLAEKPIMRGLYRSGEVVAIDKISKKLATPDTPPELVEVVRTGEINTILSQVRRDDPLGPAPSDPGSDPQYRNWETGLRNWLSGNPIASAPIPTEYDDLHTAEKKPKIFFPEEWNGQLPSLRDIAEISSRIEAAFPLREVSLFVNDELIASKTAPFLSPTVSFPLSRRLAPGDYKVTITVYDSVGNKESVERRIVVLD